MYIVQWCDKEGNLQQRRFDRRQDAIDEALALREKYGDPVEVFRADTGEPVEI